MATFRASGLTRFRKALTRVFGAAAIAGAAGVGIAMLPDHPAPVQPAVANDTPSPAPAVVEEFKPYYVGISRELNITGYAGAATAEEAAKLAFEKCDVQSQARYNRGMYVGAKGCLPVITLNNVNGPACGIIVQQNLVHKDEAIVVIGPTTYDVQRDTRHILQNGSVSAAYNNQKNPYATAVQICVEKSGAMKVTDLSYELSR